MPLLPKKPFRRRRFCAGTRFSRSALEIIPFLPFPRSRAILFFSSLPSGLMLFCSCPTRSRSLAFVGVSHRERF